MGDQSSYPVSLILNVKPKTGFNSSKIALLAHFKIDFSIHYPFKAPLISTVLAKGLD